MVALESGYPRLEYRTYCMPRKLFFPPIRGFHLPFWVFPSMPAVGARKMGCQVLLIVPGVPIWQPTQKYVKLTAVFCLLCGSPNSESRKMAKPTFSSICMQFPVFRRSIVPGRKKKVSFTEKGLFGKIWSRAFRNVNINIVQRVRAWIIIPWGGYSIGVSPSMDYVGLGNRLVLPLPGIAQ